MTSLEIILKTLRQHMPQLQQKYPISSLGVFGSYARGEATEKSDVDIVVEFNTPMGLAFVTMADEIEELLGLKTDVVSRNGIKLKYWVIIKKDIIYV